ncbi:Translocator protein [Seminavis robusta]|uniref:Translocator protein n=1 Tax=Seminavis robusta TaxID=568900 RepID=A0A9N8HM78_9STRA|nr:Translocator protein [Seminavis robusta]|eukprot:Sro885_g216110.1 Translocator protein (246) ;mRNA; r:28571-29308
MKQVNSPRQLRRCLYWLQMLALLLVVLAVPRAVAFAPQTFRPLSQSGKNWRVTTIVQLHPPTSALFFMTGGLSDDTMVAFLPMHDISYALQTWFHEISLPRWMPSIGWLTHAVGICYGSLGVALWRLASLSSVPYLILPMTWIWHSMLTLVATELVFGMQRLRAGLLVSFLLLSSIIPILWAVALLDQLAFLALLPYAAWLVLATALLQQICHLNPTDEHGYNNAMLQAGIAQLQLRAAKRVGLM